MFGHLLILCCLIKEMLIQSLLAVQPLASLLMPTLCQKTCSSVIKWIKSQPTRSCVKPQYEHT